VESMAVGTPVVSTDCPHGPGEIITHERDGLLVPPGDPEALGAALVRIARDARLREQLAEAGLRRARDFTADRIAREYGELFLSVLGSEPAGARRAAARGAAALSAERAGPTGSGRTRTG
jgi:glycosyltransferase involved in cell wall biosynthesis